MDSEMGSLRNGPKLIQNLLKISKNHPRNVRNHRSFEFLPPFAVQKLQLLHRISGFGIFSQLLPKGLEGSVLFLHDVGNAPTSGNALINYGLPQEFKDEIGLSYFVSGTKITIKKGGAMYQIFTEKT